MRSASQLLHAALGSPLSPECAPLPAGTACWVCGGDAERGMRREDWQGANFTGQNKVRCWRSTHVCEPCLLVMAWTTPMLMPVPGADKVAAANAEKKAAVRAAKLAAGERVGKERDLGWRLFSVLYDAGTVTVINKAGKPAIRAWLEAPKRGPWFAAIADTGQKHVVPWAPVNLGARGRLLFEERELAVGDFALIDAMTALLTAGATKETLATGDYDAGQIARCGEMIERFEARWSRERAGGWWELALWLAQRDEAAVATRMEAEATERKTRRNAGRKTAARAGGSDSAGDSGSARGVSRESRGQRVEALGSDPRPRASGSADDGQRRGVVDEPASKPAAARAEPRQRTLF